LLCFRELSQIQGFAFLKASCLSLLEPAELVGLILVEVSEGRGGNGDLKAACAAGAGEVTEWLVLEAIDLSECLYQVSVDILFIGFEEKHTITLATVAESLAADGVLAWPVQPVSNDSCENHFFESELLVVEHCCSEAVWKFHFVPEPGVLPQGRVQVNCGPLNV